VRRRGFASLPHFPLIFLRFTLFCRMAATACSGLLSGLKEACKGNKALIKVAVELGALIKLVGEGDEVSPFYIV
jgi:hypothetical protein